jgi:G:T-mismatch repair DNA endonuclease (very short patch repair protein)
LPKLARNIARDVRVTAEIEELGWFVMTIWECEVKNRKFLERLARKLMARKPRLATRKLIPQLHGVGRRLNRH